MDKFPSRERPATAALAPRVSAVVVVRGLRAGAAARAPLDLCLRSALAEPWVDELVLVDHGNAPEVSSALRALQADRRDVRVVKSDPSVVGVAAENLGAAQARGRWILFLDSDVVLQRGAVARLAAAAGDTRAPLIVGGRLTDSLGRDRRAAREGALNAFSAIAVALGWPSGVRARRGGGRGDDAQPANVGAVSGALMLVASEDFCALQGFDAGFGSSDAADLDLCRRAAEAGGGVLFQPAAAGVQLSPGRHGQPRARELARYVERSAKTPIERAFAAVAAPALVVLMALKDAFIGRPPARR